MNTTLKDKRLDAKYSQHVIEEWYPNSTLRNYCGEILRQSIEVAHEISPNSWSITLLSDKIRLNVGPLEVVVLQEGRVFLVTTGIDWKIIPISHSPFISPLKNHYTSIKVAHHRCDIPPQYIEDVYSRIRTSHHELIRIAASARRNTTWKRSFSPGVVEYLEGLLQTTISKPAYYISTANQAPDSILDDIQEFERIASTIAITERESIIQSRIGQGAFRKKLVDYWKGCSVFGVVSPVSILKASHIKPWRSSTNYERLDVFNGLLLLPQLDACFDCGLISFDDDGGIIVSNRLSSDVRGKLNIHSRLKLRKIAKEHLPYLQYHRNRVLQT